MKKIETKFGVIYIEEADNREEEDRIKLYDSKEGYFDYFSTDSLTEDETVEGFIEQVSAEIAALNSVDELLDYLGLNAYTVSTDWTDLLKSIYGEDAEFFADKWIDLVDGSEITLETIMRNEWVNKIGDTYIHLCE